MGRLYILDNAPGLFGRRKTKIGIVKGSNSVRRRSQDIAKSGQRNRVLFTVWLFNEQAVEARLHRRFKNRRASATGSGRTEWFWLTWLDRQALKIELTLLSLLQQFAVIAAITALGLLFMNA